MNNLITSQLLTLRDPKNALFMQKLIPTIPAETILGTKTPILRKMAKQYAKTPECQHFLSRLPHYYLEENLLHGFLIDQVKAFEEALALTEAYLPFLDNRATCDQLNPRVFKKYPDQIYQKIKIWLQSEQVYTQRFAIGLLLSHFLDQEFKPEMLDLVASVHSEEYYVQMIQAWYFATALAKQEKATLPLIQRQILSPFVQNKTIQKARESRRISDEMKEELLVWKLKS